MAGYDMDGTQDPYGIYNADGSLDASSWSGDLNGGGVLLDTSAAGGYYGPTDPTTQDTTPGTSQAATDASISTQWVMLLQQIAKVDAAMGDVESALDHAQEKVIAAVNDNGTSAASNAALPLYKGWKVRKAGWESTSDDILQTGNTDPEQAFKELPDWISTGQSIAADAKALAAQMGVAAAPVPGLTDKLLGTLNDAARVLGATGAALVSPVTGAFTAVMWPLLAAVGGIGLLLILFDKSSGGRAVVSAGARVAKTAALAGYPREDDQRAWDALTRERISKLSRDQTIRILKQNDPNGAYGDDNPENEPFTVEEARALLTELWLDNAAPADIAKFGRYSKKGGRHGLHGSATRRRK